MIFLNDQQRLLMSRYMQARIEQGAAIEYERHLRAGIARLEEKGRTEEAQELRKELSPQTGKLTDTGLQKVIQAIKTGKLTLNE